MSCIRPFPEPKKHPNSLILEDALFLLEYTHYKTLGDGNGVEKIIENLEKCQERRLICHEEMKEVELFEVELRERKDYFKTATNEHLVHAHGVKMIFLVVLAGTLTFLMFYASYFYDSNESIDSNLLFNMILVVCGTTVFLVTGKGCFLENNLFRNDLLRFLYYPNCGNAYIRKSDGKEENVNVQRVLFAQNAKTKRLEILKFFIERVEPKRMKANWAEEKVEFWVSFKDIT